MKRKPSTEATAAWIRLMRIQSRVLDAVEQDSPLRWIVQTSNEFHDCGFTLTVFANQGHALSGAQIHQTDRFLGDVEMMALHLLAFAFGGPAVEFMLQFLIGSARLIRHTTEL